MSIMLWIGIAFLAIFFIIYIWGENTTLKNVKRIQENLAEGMMTTVSAGSHYTDIPSQMKTVSTRYNLFRCASGSRLDTSEYNSYIVQGDSMQYCDIHTGNIVFTKKEFRLPDLRKFPSVIILRNNKANPGMCAFKMRRAWAICADNLPEEAVIDEVKRVMRSPDYLTLKDRAKDIYESDEQMLTNFIIKLRDYRLKRDSDSFEESIIISSTYDVDNKKIRFSIHRTSSLVGMVEYVASINKSKN